MNLPIARLARPLILALTATLAGCASMSEQECLTADWYARGVQDGRSGYARSYVEDHREACAKVGVVPDVTAYNRGHAVGIRDYCTPENGARVGRHGGYYRNSCPPDLEPGFLQRYRAAYRVYEAEQRVRQLDNDIRRKERELDSERNEDKRRRLRRELNDLDDRLRRARHDLWDAERYEQRY
jgi:hypothetical protein